LTNVTESTLGCPGAPTTRGRACTVPAGVSRTSAEPVASALKSGPKIRPRSMAMVVTAITPWPHIVL
jgi:hypothetical protein